MAEPMDVDAAIQRQYTQSLAEALNPEIQERVKQQLGDPAHNKRVVDAAVALINPSVGLWGGYQVKKKTGTHWLLRVRADYDCAKLLRRNYVERVSVYTAVGRPTWVKLILKGRGKAKSQLAAAMVQADPDMFLNLNPAHFNDAINDMMQRRVIDGGGGFQQLGAGPSGAGSASPAGQHSASPAGQQRTPSPAGQRTPSPAGQRTPSPAGQRSATPSGQRTPPPAGQRTGACPDTGATNRNDGAGGEDLDALCDAFRRALRDRGHHSEVARRIFDVAKGEGASEAIMAAGGFAGGAGAVVAAFEGAVAEDSAGGPDGMSNSMYVVFGHIYQKLRDMFAAVGESSSDVRMTIRLPAGHGVGLRIRHYEADSEDNSEDNSAST
ncbi:unnamed protein product [Pedinophyceae sp. YPF-701]|nr:unnamed protein product [Pedinophyceae sp. YPF-701]